MFLRAPPDEASPDAQDRIALYAEDAAVAVGVGEPIDDASYTLHLRDYLGAGKFTLVHKTSVFEVRDGTRMRQQASEPNALVKVFDTSLDDGRDGAIRRALMEATVLCLLETDQDLEHCVPCLVAIGGIDSVPFVVEAPVCQCLRDTGAPLEVGMGTQGVRVLRALHQNGYVHNDVRLSNMYVNRVDGAPFLLLNDYSSACKEGDRPGVYVLQEASPGILHMVEVRVLGSWRWLD